uniref:hypothetical protein n=1 Tax=Waltera sp. TaxID=2815806 RepID=UPI003AB4569C
KFTNLLNWADKGAMQLNKLIPALKKIALQDGANVNVDVLIYACYSTTRTRERKKDQEIDRRSSDRFRNSPVVAGGQKVRGIERHRHMFNRKGEMTYVIT